MAKQCKLYFVFSVLCLLVLMFVGCNGNDLPKNGDEVNNQADNGTNETVVYDASVCGDLPAIVINTQNQTLPQDKENYINCSFAIANAGDFNMSVQMAESAAQGVGIRLRGNLTMGMPKKPYRIKFAKKQSILGLTKAKSWVLLADFADKSSIKNYTAYTMGSYFDSMDFTPTPNHVVLFLNGEYQGLYLLTEQVDENEGRTNVEEKELVIENDADYPFLIEINAFAYDQNETYENLFYYDDVRQIFEIKYPKYTERVENENEDPIKDYIVSYVRAMFDTASNHLAVTNFNGREVTFADLVDINSMIDFYLINEIMVNQDMGRLSCYFHKSKDGKVVFGPLWDFDMSTSMFFDDGSGREYLDAADVFHNLKLIPIIQRFLEDDYNYAIMQARWNYIYSTLTNEQTGIAKVLQDYKEKLSLPGSCDAEKWYVEEGGAERFLLEYDYVILFINKKMTFLNNAFALGREAFLAL